MDCIVVRINTDGSVLALTGSGAEENLDLRAFGKLEAARASHVFFDPIGQTWCWQSVDGKFQGSGYATRSEAIADEIRVLVASL